LVRRGSQWPCKFYQEQLEYWDKKLKNHFKENITSFDSEKEFEILSQSEKAGLSVNWEAYWEKVNETSDTIFPLTIQVAFVVWSYLSPNWEGMGGTYLGRFMQGVQDIMNILQVDDQKIVLEFVQKIDSYYAKEVNDKADKKRKAAERKSSVPRKS